MADEIRASFEDELRIQGVNCRGFGIIPKAAVAKKAIPQCNIVFMYGEDIKTPLAVYLGVLYEANAKSVGGKLPGDEICLVLD